MIEKEQGNILWRIKNLETGEVGYVNSPPDWVKEQALMILWEKARPFEKEKWQIDKCHFKKL